MFVEVWHLVATKCHSSHKHSLARSVNFQPFNLFKHTIYEHERGRCGRMYGYATLLRSHLGSVHSHEETALLRVLKSVSGGEVLGTTRAMRGEADDKEFAATHPVTTGNVAVDSVASDN